MIRLMMALMMAVIMALPSAAQTPNARSFDVRVIDCAPIYRSHATPKYPSSLLQDVPQTYSVPVTLVMPRNFWGVQEWTLEIRYREHGKAPKLYDGVSLGTYQNGNVSQRMNTWTPGQEVTLVGSSPCIFAGGQSFHVRAWAINNETGEPAKLGRARVTLP